LVLSNANSYTGGTTISAGTLIAAGGVGVGAGTFAGGRTVTVTTGGTLQLKNVDSLGYFSGSPVLNINGGAVTTDGSAAHSNLGSVSLTGGTLTAVGSGDVYGNYVINETVSSLARPSSSTIDAATISLRNDSGHTGGTFNVADGAAAVDLSISSKIIPIPSDTVGLVKTGAGTLALSGNNIYTGGTTVSAGTLR
jgi:fibronectin-binding autotransporter adhesin